MSRLIAAAHPKSRYNLSMRTAAELLEELRQLPRHQQRWIGHELLDDEDQAGSPTEIEAAWEEEIQRRLDEIDSGAVKMISHEDHVAEMETILGASRRR